MSKADSEITPLVVELLAKLGASVESKQKVNGIILVREPTQFSFGRASYEITEVCNYRCSHCYLGHKTKNNLSVLDKKKIIELIEISGCIWLQITGGEPLLDKDFIEVYSYAYSLGFLVTISTNGSLLSEYQITDILKAYPPYRLTISVYGATADSYEALTQTSGSFQKFMNGINWAKKTAIRTRLNIITTKYNQGEIDEMTDLAKNFGFEYYVFSTISPTISGNSAPIELMAQDCESIKKRNKFIPKEDCYTSCRAGQISFHVNSVGNMSICKTARESSVSLLYEGGIGFHKLFQFSKELLNSPSLCSSCDSRKSCTTCPLILKLYLQSGLVPSFVCRKYYSKGGEKNESET
ncbi:MAG: radical SAM protein [bacterium]|nr:radical SAM protein [bacterium]